MPRSFQAPPHPTSPAPSAPEVTARVLVADGGHGIEAIHAHLRRSDGVAVIDWIKQEFTEPVLRQFEATADDREITALVLTHPEPDRTGAVPELLRRTPDPDIYVSPRGEQVGSIEVQRKTPACARRGRPLCRLDGGRGRVGLWLAEHPWRCDQKTSLVAGLVDIDTSGRLGAAFGTYGWTGKAVPMVEARLQGPKTPVPQTALRNKMHPTAPEQEQRRAFGRQLAAHLTSQAQPREIEFGDLLS